MTKILEIDEQYYPTQYGDVVSLRVVLVEGNIGDYAAYAGIGTTQFVAAMGNKISFDMANAVFGGKLERKKYRI